MESSIRYNRAWLVTWEHIGDHAKPSKKVAAILDYRLGEERVRFFVEQYYAATNYSLGEQTAIAKRRSSNPYPAKYFRIDGKAYRGAIEVGHNPFMYARIVQNLVVSVDDAGEEKLTFDDFDVKAYTKKLREFLRP